MVARSRFAHRYGGPGPPASGRARELCYSLRESQVILALPSDTKQFSVAAAGGPYTVHCGRGLLARAGEFPRGIPDLSSIFLLSSPRVWRRWGRGLERSLRITGAVRVVLFDDAERRKTLATVEKICRELARGGADRRSLIVALGGGVVGDVAGFAAASYARGLRIVHIPTTLVAQIDSAIGGKTGVNLPEGKNLVGAFFSPRLVICDPRLLRTLPPRQFRSGLYEAVKYGVIADEMLFGFIERRLPDLLRQQPAALEWMIERCIRIKAEIVSADERESGLRQTLNFGHTVGHALEAAMRYRRFLHGEAVGWGMIAVARLSVALGRLPAADAVRIERVVQRIGTLPAWPAIPPARLLARMRTDKKARAGRARFVLPEKIGKVDLAEDVPEEAVLAVLRGMKWAIPPPIPAGTTPVSREA